MRKARQGPAVGLSINLTSEVNFCCYFSVQCLFEQYTVLFDFKDLITSHKIPPEFQKKKKKKKGTTSFPVISVEDLFVRRNFFRGQNRRYPRRSRLVAAKVSRLIDLLCFSCIIVAWILDHTMNVRYINCHY